MSIMGFEVSPEQIEPWLNLAIQYGLNIIYAVIIWVVGSMVAGWASRRARSAALRGTKGDEAAAGFLASIARWLVLAVVAIAILNLFGINATSLVAVLGAATLAVGLALQGTLANFAAGVMLLVFRPFKVGDYVATAGHEGTVRAIEIFTTELATVDNVQIIIPNSEVWGASIVNYSAHDRRRVDLTIGIDYGSDIEKALATIRSILSNDPRASGEPEPFVKVTNLGDSSVDVTLRVWCQAADYWDLKFDLTRRIKEDFDAAGIAIPFPHVEVVHKDGAPAKAAEPPESAAV